MYIYIYWLLNVFDLLHRLAEHLYIDILDLRNWQCLRSFGLRAQARKAVAASTRCCNDFARKGLQHMWPGACQSLCFLWQFLVCKVASTAEQRTFGISEVCLLALGIYRPQPQKVSSPCLYNRSSLQSSWLLQEHGLVADHHCCAKCIHVALGGFYGSDLHLRGISGAGLIRRIQNSRAQTRTVAASCLVFPVLARRKP